MMLDMKKMGESFWVKTTKWTLSSKSCTPEMPPNTGKQTKKRRNRKIDWKLFKQQMDPSILSTTSHPWESTSPYLSGAGVV